MSTYEELKKKRDAAVKAFQKASATLTKTNEEFRPVLLAHLASLPDGWYAEHDAKVAGDFPIYLKINGTWLWNGYGGGFVEPDWLDEDGFDIEVIPLANVKF